MCSKPTRVVEAAQVVVGGGRSCMVFIFHAFWLLLGVFRQCSWVVGAAQVVVEVVRIAWSSSSTSFGGWSAVVGVFWR